CTKRTLPLHTDALPPSRRPSPPSQQPSRRRRRSGASPAARDPATPPPLLHRHTPSCLSSFSPPRADLEDGSGGGRALGGWGVGARLVHVGSWSGSGGSSGDGAEGAGSRVGERMDPAVMELREARAEVGVGGEKARGGLHLVRQLLFSNFSSHKDHIAILMTAVYSPFSDISVSKPLQPVTLIEMQAPNEQKKLIILLNTTLSSGIYEALFLIKGQQKFKHVNPILHPE
ncbi:hypothetical protein EJB05_00285, partial [Eragrostis curvula]